MSDLVALAEVQHERLRQCWEVGQNMGIALVILHKELHLAIANVARDDYIGRLRLTRTLWDAKAAIPSEVGNGAIG